MCKLAAVAALLQMLEPGTAVTVQQSDLPRLEIRTAGDLAEARRCCRLSKIKCELARESLK